MLIAELLVTHLKQLGVTHVFGIPGKPVYPLIAAMDQLNLPFVLTRHEGGAGFSAAGYAMQRQGLGVAVGTSGPGGTNLLTAAGQAKAYSAPVLFLTGHASAAQTGKPVSQDSTVFGTDLVDMFRQVSKFSASIARAEQYRMFLEHAVYTALTPPRGPVHLNIPADILTAKIVPFELSVPRIDIGISSHISEAAELIAGARRPLILAGKGVHSSQAYKELQELSEKFSIPVATTPGGKGAFPTYHPNSLGAYGLGGNDSSDLYMNSGIDVLLAIGTKLSDMSLPNLKPEYYPQHVVHLDWDYSVIGKALPVSVLPVIGDIKRNLSALLAAADGYPARAEETDALFREAAEQLAFAGMQAAPDWSANRAAKVISEMTDKETILFGDCGSHSFYAIEHYAIERPGTFFFDDVFGAMGNAISLAIGAKLAEPGNRVMCITGDGCMMMHGMEVSTAVNAGIDLVFVVFNNEQLDMVDKSLHVAYGKSAGSRFAPGMNFETFASSIGAAGYRCRNEEELRRALLEAFKPAGRPSIVEVMLPKEELPALVSKRMAKK